jgi:RES domain-containing protein
VLARIGGEDLTELFELESATNDRLLAESSMLPGVDVRELVFGVPYYRIVNAAFCHAHPLGSRFNGPDRGCWYAGLEIETSIAEVAFHKSTEYAEIGMFEDSVTYDDYLSDVSAELHDLRSAAAFQGCLDPQSYVESQLLAEKLLAMGSLGVVYPSVRRPAGTCLAIFRPTVVANVRQGSTCRFTWSGTSTPTVEIG